MKRTLKGIRADLGLTVEEMAKIMKVSRATWTSKEQGKSTLTALELIQLSQLAKVPMEEIEVVK